MSTTAAVKLLRPKRRLKRPILAVIALCGVGGWAFGAVDKPRPIVPQAKQVEAPKWVSVDRPVEIFGLSSLLFDPATFHYRAERRTVEPGRRDTLSFGSPDKPEPYFAIAIQRETSGATSDPVALALRVTGAPAGPVAGTAALQSKFGVMEAADLPIGRRTCLTFSRYEASASTAIEGVFCPAANQAPDPRIVTCTIDRLDLLGASRDKRLLVYFIESERRRDFCGAGRAAAYDSDKNWLDPKEAIPKLRS